MIFPLASQPGIEVKAVHRSQDPERDGIASSTSQREGAWGECSWLCHASSSSRHKQWEGRGRREGRGVPERCALHPRGLLCWEEVVDLAGQCVFPPRGTALQGSGKKGTEQSCNQKIKSLRHKSFFFKSFYERQPKKVPSHSQLYATF